MKWYLFLRRAAHEPVQVGNHKKNKPGNQKGAHFDTFKLETLCQSGEAFLTSKHRTEPKPPAVTRCLSAKVPQNRPGTAREKCNTDGSQSGRPNSAASNSQENPPLRDPRCWCASSFVKYQGRGALHPTACSAPGGGDYAATYTPPAYLPHGHRCVCGEWVTTCTSTAEVFC